VRRKRNSACFNTQNFERPVSYEHCTCTEEDWECDIGYERIEDGPCSRSATFDPESLNPPEFCRDYYEYSIGYRKVAGDFCKGGIDHSPILYSCPGFVLFSAKTFYSLIILAAGLFCVNFIYENKEMVKQYIEKISSYIPTISNR